ncbi:hypothetical protein ACFYYB_33190 [Streptomyces sp. NPDC002886]|uniref:hypothetical protein n=1 Tax=Streptomyces sp. NPDC002886 TaxID=3364667 RepID=UPI0036B145AE
MGTGLMQYFGFYEAMPYKPGAGIRPEELTTGPLEVERAALARYMDACETLTVVPGVESDPFDPAQSVMGGFSLKTDGEWIWPDIAGRLVREREFAPPAEFARHAAELGFSAPALTPKDIVEVFRSAKSDLY